MDDDRVQASVAMRSLDRSFEHKPTNFCYISGFENQVFHLKRPIELMAYVSTGSA